jgi:hypothetical protein
MSLEGCVDGARPMVARNKVLTPAEEAIVAALL